MPATTPDDSPKPLRVDKPGAAAQELGSAGNAEAAVGVGQPTKTETDVPNVFRLIPSFEPTQLGVVRTFYDVYRHDFRYIHDEGLWLHWNGTVWCRDFDGFLRRTFAQALGRRIREDIARARAKFEDEELDRVLSTLNKWLQWVESEQGVRDGIKLFASQPEITVRETDLDAQAFKLTFTNGTLDLASGTFGPPVREDLTTRVVPYAYDPKARSPRWERFLARVQPDPEARQYLQRLVGRSLVWNSERRPLIIHFGSGRNGKTVFLTTATALAPAYAVTADAGTFLEHRGDRIENDLARMTGARLVIVRELASGRAFDEALIKSLTGGDTVTARFLHHEFFDFRVGFLLMLATNHHPMISDSPAMRDRIVVVLWSVRIPEDEVDPLFFERSLKPELPGVLNWAIVGFREWRFKGLAPPASIARFTDMIGEESVPLSRFVEEVLESGTDDRFVPASWVFKCYAEWARRLGMKPMTQAWLGRRLGEVGGFEFSQFGALRVRGYSGWRVRAHWTAVIEDATANLGEPLEPVDLLLGSCPVDRRRQPVGEDRSNEM